VVNPASTPEKTGKLLNSNEVNFTVFFDKNEALSCAPWELDKRPYKNGASSFCVDLIYIGIKSTQKKS